ncbi:MAG: N-acetyltransferase [Alphaproteobacteria bacterium]|nr:N-acetyltransferase [Alphaproteobacteria bacterium]
MTNQGDNQRFTIVADVHGLEDGISGLIRAAFGGQDDEAILVRQLRTEGAMLVELAAVADGVPVGHIAFSRLATQPKFLALAALAPLSVTPARQGRGIGSALARAGLEACRTQGIAAVAVLGDPAYYGRFGFTLEAARMLDSAYSGPHFQALALTPGALSGGPWTVRYPAAFGDP